MLAMPIDLDTLSLEERRARLRKREAQLQSRKEYEQELSDDLHVERYRQFWTRTKK
ncbi:MRPL55 isoform 19 [Pan troglodytes]|nr:MRPL55 isoform 8 [Pan troglodytes]PNI13733.1 MRPL55 isoform 12 [Pan troglodytes]PNI13739.1 MRPL55 isoform 19 [Pan troglodytes]